MGLTYQLSPGDGLFTTVVRRHRGALGLSSLLLSLSASLELVPHLVVYAAAIEIFSEAPTAGWLVTLAGIAFVGIAARFLLLGAGYVVSHGVAFRLMRELRLALADKLARVPSSFFIDHPSGDLKKVLVDDVIALEGVFAHNLPELASGLFVPLLAAGVLLWTDWRLALLGIALFPVAVAVQAVVMSGYGDGWERWHAAEARANQGVLEFIRGIVVLKAFDRDASSLGRVRDGIYGIRDLAVEMTRQSMPGYALFFSLLSGNLLVVLPSGLALFLADSITRDELVLFVALGAGMLLPLVKLLYLAGNIGRVQEVLRRIESVLTADELPTPGQGDPLAPDPDVCFGGVGFTYPGRSHPAVEDVSFTLEPGTVTAIVGASGAGKTTLVKLLVRAYDVDSGSITIGGRDLRSLSSRQRASLISHVSQDTTLFDATVRDNLLLARPEADVIELEAATRAARAHEFITALPDGYDTALGDRGSRLSGGERQRLAIARALLKGAPIVVLDEVTASVDPQSERGIQEGLSALAADRIVLVVAHRLRTIAGADQILVLDDGRLVDSGRHAELVDRNEAYASLWQAQERAACWALSGGAA